MGDEGEYTDQERAQYRPAPCPGCGTPVRQEWADAGYRGTTHLWVRAGMSCRTVGCDGGEQR